MSSISDSITNKRLSKNTVINFIGYLAPAIIAVFLIPGLIDGYGKEKFGILSILWMGVSYFGLFDLGVGKALTKKISHNFASNHIDDISQYIWTSLAMVILVAISLSILIISFADYVVTDFLKVSENLTHETIISFKVLGLAVPFVSISATLVGVLEAHHQFSKISTIRAPLGAMMFIAPFLTLTVSTNIVFAALALLVVRAIACAFYYKSCLSIKNLSIRLQTINFHYLRDVLSFGGWLSVSNIISPIMVSFDRVFIGSICGMTLVSYYVTPFEMLSRFQIIPVAIFGVLYPSLSHLYHLNQEKFKQLYDQSSLILCWIMLVFLGMIAVFAQEILLLWLSIDFQEISSLVMFVLAIGWIVNTNARPAHLFLMITERTDIIAKLHLFECFMYLIFLYFSIVNFGIYGAAFCWLMRVTVDSIALNYIAIKKNKNLYRSFYKTTAITLFSVAFYTGLYIFQISAYLKIIMFSIFLIIVSFYIYKSIDFNIKTTFKTFIN